MNTIAGSAKVRTSVSDDQPSTLHSRHQTTKLPQIPNTIAWVNNGQQVLDELSACKVTKKDLMRHLCCEAVAAVAEPPLEGGWSDGSIPLVPASNTQHLKIDLIIPKRSNFPIKRLKLGSRSPLMVGCPGLRKNLSLELCVPRAPSATAAPCKFCQASHRTDWKGWREKPWIPCPRKVKDSFPEHFHSQRKDLETSEIQ